ncbi:hypothetical protein [Shouchella hunanensis]|uniref:Uncharacterized protein n=1 Tax=Shouchella hunanensis TaxID=766894 RepID=A0ABY7WBB4_9BACI|nr:hypothetical protein [Shouchella hunanensis]WDF04903.1 hypothetical protein PQ477_05425 [Shouchella hunanensis]
MYQLVFNVSFKLMAYLLAALLLSLMVGMLYSLYLLLIGTELTGFTFWDHSFLAGYFISPIFISLVISYFISRNYLSRSRSKVTAIFIALLV